MGGDNKPLSLPRWFLVVTVGRKPAWTLVRLAIIVIGAWAVFSYVLTPPIKVSGISMLPTYHDGQINFLYRRAYSRHDPERGDVVGVRFSGESLLLLKRIVGLPGEKIAFVRGHLYINDQLMEEPYVKTPCDWDMPPRQLGFDEFYVVGDNRGMDFQDHKQGVAERKRIVGRVLFHGNS